MVSSGFILIGKVIKPHGLKGELSVYSYADSPLLFAGLSRVYLRKKGQKLQKYPVLNFREHKNTPLLQLEGINTRTRALEEVLAEVWARRRDLPRLQEDEIYLQDLIGIEVYLANNELVGHISAIESTSPQEVWNIHTLDGNSFLFPVVDQFIQELDIDQGYVVIDPPPGLTDIFYFE